MHILIIGGGAFLGTALLDAALAQGHAVSVFNRGRARQQWPHGVRNFVGDRRADLGALADAGPFDAVIDTCGYCPADVLPAAAALAACPRYQFVSSISAFAAHDRPGMTEAAELASAAGLADDAAVTGDTYGPLKAQCERVLAQRLGQRLQVIRPGLIVGPGDPSGRFSYWPWRVAAGGRMLVPDVPPPARLQFIDVRDLAGWMVTLLERAPTGACNATGRADEVTWPSLIDTCQRAVRATGREAAEAVPVSESLLQGEGIVPWRELPLWLPADDAQYAGFMAFDTRHAQEHGLRTRALDESVQAVLAEPLPVAGDKRLADKLSAQREAELLRLAAAGARGRPPIQA